MLHELIVIYSAVDEGAHAAQIRQMMLVFYVEQFREDFRPHGLVEISVEQSIIKSNYASF